MIKITYDKEKKGWFVETFKSYASKRCFKKQFLKEPIPNFVPATKRKMFQEAKNQTVSTTQINGSEISKKSNLSLFLPRISNNFNNCLLLEY